ncbi:unnamed protein product [Brassica oleracea]
MMFCNIYIFVSIYIRFSLIMIIHLDLVYYNIKTIYRCSFVVWIFSFMPLCVIMLFF